ncbi:MAG: DNA-processing protein DprA [Saprospiraceae bacterium]|nr:DNA-processing protein DprA [Saprospiraceae bacterium]
MNRSPDLLYRIALKMIPQVGAVTARHLVSHCGSVEAVFRQRAAALQRIPGVGATLARNILRREVLIEAEAELRRVIEHDIQVHFYLDASYPQRLIHYNQSPILLYGKGRLDLNAARMVAIVGTRQPTPYGIAACEQIIRDLSEYGPTVISGLAYGIDVTAHRAALQYGLPTIGVLGSGCGRVYPQAHRKLALRMMPSGGLVTEFDYLTGPDKENFPARNRIVAGMVDAVIVVESGRSGGSMITAEFANVFHKDVMAVPGRVSDSRSQGCNLLIREHKAHLITNGQDVAALLGWDQQTADSGGHQREMFPDLDETERLIVELVSLHETMEIDALAAQSKLPLSELATVLLSLEFKGIVKALPGKRYLIR